MNCPYCHKAIHAFTGLQEAQKFQAHLAKCRKRPGAIILRDGRKSVVANAPANLMDALNIRASSSQ